MLAAVPKLARTRQAAHARLTCRSGWERLTVGRLLEVVDRRHPRRSDLRARAGTATLRLTVQLRFDLPPPEATALAAGVWLLAPDDDGAMFVAGLGACNPA